VFVGDLPAVLEAVERRLVDRLGTGERRLLVLAVMAFNLTRIAGIPSGPDFVKATTGTIRRKLINVSARMAVSGWLALRSSRGDRGGRPILTR
jgi:hypothetical protein